MKLILAALILSLSPWPVKATPNHFVYEGFLTDSSDQPVGIGTPVAKSMSFELHGYSSGSLCRLYAETHSVSVSEGNFAAKVGLGSTPTWHVGGVSSLSSLFAAKQTLSNAAEFCSFDPQASDRKYLLRVRVEGVALGDIEIAAAPFAMSAEKIGRHSTTSLMRVEDGGGAPIAKSALSANQFDRLVKWSQQDLDLTAPSSGQVLKWNGTQWAPAADDAGVALGFTPLNPAQNLSDLGNISTARSNLGLGSAAQRTVGTSAGQLPELDAGAKLPSAVLPNLGVSQGGTGLTSVGTAHQFLGVNGAGTDLEYKSLMAGSGITLTPAAGSVTIAATGSGGTVTSVAVNGATGMNSTGGPITGSGVINLSWATHTARLVLASPELAAGAPSFRELRAKDIRSSVTGSFFSDSSSCTAQQALSYNSVSDIVACMTVVPQVANTSTLSTGKIWVGDGSNKAQEVSLSGDAGMNSSGVVNLATTGVVAGTYGSGVSIPVVGVDSKGRVTSLTTNALDVTAALGYTPLNQAGGTMTGSLSLGGFPLSGVGDLSLGPQKVLHLGRLSDFDESLLTLSGAPDRGKIWYNTTQNEVRYYDGSSIKSLDDSSGGALPALPSGQIWVGTASNSAANVALTGDASLSNTGQLTLNTVPVNKGGTGLNTVAAGEMLYANAANSFDRIPAGQMGQVLSSNGATSPTWREMNEASGPSLIRLFEDFIGFPATAAATTRYGDIWVHLVTGSASSVASSDLHSPGIARANLSTSGSIVSFMFCHPSQLNSFRFGVGEKTTFEVFIRSISMVGSNQVTLRAGFFDTLSTGTNQNDALFFETELMGTSYWDSQFKSRSTATAGPPSSHFSVTDSFFHPNGVKYTIEVTDGVLTKLAVNDVLKTANLGTVQVPTSAGRETCAGLTLIKSSGSSLVTFDIDYIGLKRVITSPRL